MTDTFVDLAKDCTDFKPCPSCPKERSCFFCLFFYSDDESKPLNRWYCHIAGKEEKRRLMEVALYKGQTKLVES